MARNISAFTNMFGVSDPDFVMAFSAVPWESESDRNAFLNEIAHMNIGYRVKDGNG